ncbi:MAG: DUF6362 family protein [Acetobacteraceae bacterium]|nr:DUF6362 family protein [Acetobacteraceae bacterium]
MSVGLSIPMSDTSITAINANSIIARLEEAGTILLSLPHSGPSTRLRMSRHDVVHSAIEAYGWQSPDTRLRPAVPDSAQISRMDEAMGWIAIIPADKYVLKRIVGARCLVGPLTGRHLYPWRRLASLLGADHKAIQRWHGQGIDLIVSGLRRNGSAAC